MKKIKLLIGALLLLALSFILESNTGINPIVTFSVLSIGGAITRAGMKYQSNLALFIIDPSDLSFHGKEAVSISEGIYEATFNKPKLRELHRIATNIKAKTQIPILGKLGLVGKKKGACDTTPNPGGITMSEKFWNPEYISDRFEECWATLKESFFVWGLANNIKKEDLTDTDFALFLEERISDAVLEMLIRVAHFGDTGEALVADSGNVTDGVDLEYFTILDGMWPQLIDIATADTNRRVTIAKNSQTTYANQKFNSTDTTNRVATIAFESLIYDADFRLRDIENKRIYATQSLCDQYARELKAASGVQASWERIEGGYSALKIDNVMIIALPIWDTMIRTYFDNGTVYYLPHRAVLTTPDNIPVGVEDEASMGALDPFYDKKTKTYNVDFGMNLDMKVLEPYKCQIAY